MNANSKYWLMIIVVGTILIIYPTVSQAATYYVSPSGSGSWSNCINIETPCSWQTAMASAVAGDTVYFRNGTYTPSSCSTWEYVAIGPRNSGTASNPITFIAYPGENPIIAACPNAMPAFGARDVSYIIWDGFSATLKSSSSTSWLFLYWNSTGSIVRNCNFTGNNVTSGNNAPVRIEESLDNQVYGNIIHDNIGAYTNTAAIWLFSATRAKIYNNTIRNCRNGIQQKTGPNVDNEIFRNFIYDIAEDGIMLNEQASGGRGIKVYQNILASVQGNAINIYPGGVAPNYQADYQIYNNTIYNAARGVAVGQLARNNQIWNNIISGDSNPHVRYYSGDAMPSISDYNDFYGSSLILNLNYKTNYSNLSAWSAATSRDFSSMKMDPFFVNPGGTNPIGYQLASGSPCKGTGKDGKDIGAYPNGNDGTVIGAASFAAPTAPSGLQVLQ